VVDHRYDSSFVFYSACFCQGNRISQAIDVFYGTVEDLLWRWGMCWMFQCHALPRKNGAEDDQQNDRRGMTMDTSHKIPLENVRVRDRSSEASCYDHRTRRLFFALLLIIITQSLIDYRELPNLPPKKATYSVLFLGRIAHSSATRSFDCPHKIFIAAMFIL